VTIFDRLREIEAAAFHPSQEVANPAEEKMRDLARALFLPLLAVAEEYGDGCARVGCPCRGCAALAEVHAAAAKVVSLHSTPLDQAPR